MLTDAIKQQILSLAIRGKLTDQRPEDGSAEELYLSIREEKKRLIKAGKIKKEKPLPPIEEKDIPFDIPENWKWVRLGKIGSWSSGATPRRSNPEYFGGNIPWLKTGDLTDGLVDDVPEYITEKALNETSVRLQPAGAVLIAMYGATIGKLGILTRPMTTNQACCACIPHNGIDRKFLFYFLMASRQKFIERGEGGAQPNISKEKITAFLLPLPPLAEQERIVEKLEAIMTALQDLEGAKTRAQAIKTELHKSLLQEAIQGKLTDQRPEDGSAEDLYRSILAEKKRLIKAGKLKKENPLPPIEEKDIPFDIPENWKWVRLGEITTYAQSKEKIEPSDIAPDTWSLDLEDIEKDSGRVLVRNLARERKITGSKSIFHKGELLYSKLRPYLKKILIAPEDGVCTPELVNFSAYNGISHQYLVQLLRSPYVDNAVNGKTYGVKMPRTNTETMCNLLLPLPPLAEQERIVAKLEELLPLCD
ncbi:MAG: restriction endonuclease subunit S [Akkermansia muciniphila]|nr:restriction endonuclease subunit S [Akkermansia muciniphila]